jgi:hypothetical protein
VLQNLDWKFEVSYMASMLRAASCGHAKADQTFTSLKAKLAAECVVDRHIYQSNPNIMHHSRLLTLLVLRMWTTWHVLAIRDAPSTLRHHALHNIIQIDPYT